MTIDGALNDLNNLLKADDIPIYYKLSIKKVMETIKMEKTPKVGKWVKYGIPRCGEQHYQCTSCGYYVNFGEWGEFYTKEFKYCPNCCAKMQNED